MAVIFNANPTPFFASSQFLAQKNNIYVESPRESHSQGGQKGGVMFKVGLLQREIFVGGRIGVERHVAIIDL